MTPSPAVGADRGNGASGRAFRAGAAVPAILVLLLAGLALRLIIAYVFFPGSGFESDLGTFKAWSLSLADEGPGTFYRPDRFADYPPGYLYVLWLIGGLGHMLAPVFGTDAGSVVGNLIKLPAMFADVAVAYVLYRLTARAFADHPRRGALALGAAALFLFNPVTWYDSALWGQTDSIGALVMLIGVALLLRGHSEAAMAVAVLAGVVKPQFGVVLGPLVLAVLVRRHLLRPGSGPRPERVPERLRGWFVEEQGPWRLLSSATVGLIVLMALLAPFSLDIPGYLKLVASAAGTYHYLSVNAYNGWALVGSGGGQSLAAGGGWSDDLVRLIGPLSGVTVGTILLLGGFVLGVARVLWRDDRRSILVVAAYLSLAFFILPTRVHERYMFPAFAFLPLLAVRDSRWLAVTIVLSVATFMNLHGVLTIETYATPNIEGLPLGAAFRSSLGIATSALLHMGVFAFLAWQLRPGAAHAEERRAAAASGAGEPGAGALAGAAGAPAAGWLGSGAHAADPAVASWSERVSGWSDRAAHGRASGATGDGGATAVAAGRNGFMGRLLGRGVRADRSAALVAEPTGRLDRLDLLLVALVLLSALSMRTWRLSEPYGMHFDEVYHARTGTEFLQHWRYNIPHDIYEYTHPHLAKYLIAAGLVAFGGEGVDGQTQLGASVRDAAVETRWSPTDSPTLRNGDRLYVATGRDLRVFDLATRRPVAAISGFASALTMDESRHVLYVADSGANLFALPTAGLDRLAPGSAPPAPEPLASLADESAPVERLTVTNEGANLVAVLANGTVVSVDTETGEETGRATIPGALEAQSVGPADRVVVDRGQVDDPGAVAQLLADTLDEPVARLQVQLAAAPGRVTIASYLDEEQTTDLQASIDEGALPGVTLERGETIAVAARAGVVILDARTLEEVHRVSLAGPATGLALMPRGLEHPTLYVATGTQVETVPLKKGEPPARETTLRMPNQVTDTVWNPATELVHAVGRTRDGSAPTVYVIEPHGNAVFADTRLPFEPRAVVLDAQPERPSEDRQQLLAMDATGRLAAVNTGGHGFAWRMPGVIAGALMAVCLYLLARVLFRRRSVAVIASVLALVDGMFFANARIAMNDTYVALFIVAAFTIFAPLYLGVWRRARALVLGLPVVGVLLGLALASKWVGAYAIGAILLLVLLRSALGRVMALAGMVALTGALGYLALATPPASTNTQQNVLFLLVMVALTVALAVLIVVRPVRFTLEELRFATLAPAVIGLLALIAGVALGSRLPREGLLTGDRLLQIGGLSLVVGVGAYAAAMAAGRLGIGPLARPRTYEVSAAEGAATDPATPAPSGWLRPGSTAGVPWMWAMLCLTLVPVAIYIASYVPWVALGNHWDLPIPLVQPSTAGQGFLELQASMYSYHNELRASHAASSPWWAWPFDLKPVWFYQDDFANGTTGAIYDAGNLVIFWLAIPAVAWAAYQAWRRRSLPLTLVVVAIACLWLPWARIDRATFQYHVFTSLPFTIIALAYFLADLWHGPSRRTWLLARIAAAVAIVGVPVLWLGRGVLCGLAGTQKANPNGQACGSVSERLVVTDEALASLVVVGLGIAAFVWQLRRLAARRAAAASLASGPSALGAAGPSRRLPPVAGPVVAIAGTVLALALVQLVLPGQEVFSGPLGVAGPYFFAAMLLVPLAVLAYLVLLSRDPRRYVAGVIGAAALWFVAWYPNLSGLPLPTSLLQKYLFLLPSYNYDFQFAVNTADPYKGPIADVRMFMLLGGVMILTVAAMYAANAWRQELAARRAARSLPMESEPA